MDEKPPALGEKLSAEELRRWEAYEIVQQLKAMKESGALVHDGAEYRPFEFGDVAILFQAMSNAPLYEEVFKQNTLPYVTIAGKGYYDRQEVWDMLNLLRALHNTADDLALASVLRSPMFGLSDEALLALRLQRDDEDARLLLWDALQHNPAPVPEEDRPALLFARECLNRLLELAGRVTVDSLLAAALDETAYDAILTALPDGDRRRGNLDKLMQMARQSGRVALGEFLAYVQELTAVEPREGEAAVEGAGAVQLMSVHKSKGLEFPVVVLADASWTRRGRSVSPLVMDPELGAATVIFDEAGERIEPFIYQQARELAEARERAERKRLLYVAATRARDYLIISGKKSTRDSWIDWLLAALQIDGENAGVFAYAWGQVAVNVPAGPPSIEFLIAAPSAQPLGWGALNGMAFSGAGIPRLAGPVPAIAPREDRHLSVTQLEDLGSIGEYRPESLGKRRFRHSVLHDAPPPARPVSRDAEAWASVRRRIIGSVVHRALQLGLEGDHPEILRAYAWDENVTDAAHVNEVIWEAQQILEQFKSQGEPETLRNASRVLREIPFLHRVENRVIHGVIDVAVRV